ncbi:outer membrane beta-barrel protein [Congregibacter variabilis]|uniref:Outer membrane beta-barrel protein n=1 Tax=Congregibacter variabilis TaxID=3081200 RepID=A0ABZ0I3I7_9GAMM|nr:outer membrane beta-barrel protein [Congregibacter sp. IMCC43200]
MNTYLAGVTALALIVFAATAQAQSDAGSESTGLFNKKHMLSVGMTRQSTNSSVSATSEGFDPVVIDLNGLDIGERDYSYFVDYRYRLKPKWSIFAGTFQFLGSGKKFTERDLNYDGVEFTTGSDLRSELNIDIYILDVLYTVHRSENVEVMLGGGVHAFDLGVGFSGSVRINDQSSEVRRASSTLLAPVPNLRAAATWSLTDSFGFSLVAGWLSADVDEYSGDFSYGHLRAHYQISDRFGASLGYQITDIDITQARSRGELSFNTELDGPSLTATYSF